MLKVENTDVSGIAAAFRGMRNPKNSWDASDSRLCATVNGTVFVPGEKDMALASKLANAGTDHGKFLRMIVVHCDVIAPLYWWKQMDQYKVGTVSDSCSTMHKIHEKEFSIDDFSHDRLLVVEKLELVIGWLNEYRDLYVNWDDTKRYEDSCGVELRRKDIWWQMIQLLPSSYNQRRTMMFSYANLRAMYHARNGHKLDEWQQFREWIETLPYAKQLIIGEGG